jgi:hypothetical protein
MVATVFFISGSGVSGAVQLVAALNVAHVGHALRNDETALFGGASSDLVGDDLSVAAVVEFRGSKSSGPRPCAIRRRGRIARGEQGEGGEERAGDRADGRETW